jgi:pimeloyl-ACP methyl ester carboxylesterase
MPAVFVHGVPDTHRVWRALVCRLRRDDVVVLSLPGCGCGIPAGFECTKEGYCDWLLSELRRVEGPIDLVGHDWYEWHKAAKLWQTPGVGEQVMEQLTPEALASALVAAGVPQADAMSAAEHLDPTMKRSILALYRSAVRAGSEWEGDLQRIQVRGLVLWGEQDPYAAPIFGSRLAARTRARFVPFSGCSHWWQLERPDDVAKQLEGHWS